LVRVRFTRPDLPRPTALSLAAAALYTASSAWMLYFGLLGKTQLLGWLAAIVLVALVAYAFTRQARDGARA